MGPTTLFVTSLYHFVGITLRLPVGENDGIVPTVTALSNKIFCLQPKSLVPSFGTHETMAA
jgi:hypothetical protein